MVLATAESVPERGLAVNRARSTRSGAPSRHFQGEQPTSFASRAATWIAGADLALGLAGCDQIAQYFSRGRAKTTT
ncbi:hypothetical protein WME77_05970 [Sorangium sp. So ce764]|uniref:hypothetical protein n=1 Tax=Sorangium sp. So ce764 TaxID=3133320 RepID=UPI003F625ED9